jgi:RNA polymerase sigma factor (TIGR02999 family)
MMEESELIKLVKGWQNKEPDATQILMGMTYHRIKELAVKHRENIPDNANTAIFSQSATDLAHDVYERLTKAESTLPITTLREFYSYLNATVRNTFIDHYRKLVETKSRNPERTSLMSPRAVSQPGHDIDDSYELSSLSLNIDALEKHYPRQAEAVELRYYAQRSNKEIARLLSVSIRTVENDLRFAKAWIKLQMQ